MSALGEHAVGEFRADAANQFHRVRPQVLRAVLQTFGRAVDRTVLGLGERRLHEPQFTRQLCVNFGLEKNVNPTGPRYHIEHQSELPSTDSGGNVVGYRRLDLKLLFGAQLGRMDDYLCFECKYLDVGKRESDREYVDEGVDRIVSGTYAAGHPWAVMVGLERLGPLIMAVDHVQERLLERYGPSQGFKADPTIRLDNVRESDHPQAGGAHQITIVHSFHLIVPPSPE